MAKGDKCRVENCNRIVTLVNRTLCSMHKGRLSVHKSFDLPPKKKLPDGIVKICKIHGELTIDKCFSNKAKVKLIDRVKIYTDYRCQKCRRQRYYKWVENNPGKRKQDYEKIKHTEIHHKRYRKHLLKKKFSITPEEYEELSNLQNNACFICKNEETSKDPRTNRIRYLSVDHCHITGKIRGLLCNRCNRILGHINDSIEILESAIKYLKAHQ